MFKAIKNLFRPQFFQSTSQRIVIEFGGGKSIELDNAIETVAELAAIVNYITNSFISGEFKEFQNGELVENSNIIQLLEKPHWLYTQPELFKNLYEDLIIHGYGILYAKSDSLRENTKVLNHLEAYRTELHTFQTEKNQTLEVEDITEVVSYAKYLGTARDMIIEDTENLIIFTANTRFDIYDKKLKFRSPLQSALDAMRITPALYNSLRNIMENGGMLGFISNATTESGGSVIMDGKEKEKIQNEFLKYGTQKGQRRLAFVDYDVKYVPITSPVKDMKFTEQRKMVKEVIADILNFETLLLNNADGNKYANYHQARKSFFSEYIVPNSKIVSSTLTNYFFEFNETNEIIIDYSELDVFNQSENEKYEKLKLRAELIVYLNDAITTGQITRDIAINILSTDYDINEIENLIQ